MKKPIIQPDVKHDYRLGFYWLLFLVPVFFLTYGLVNQFTATRQYVGHMAFAWEKSIPFVPWTIIPYWSIDLLYVLSLFICTSSQECRRHGLRLLMASIVACTGFLLFPLQFGFVRPQTHGLFGWLFQQLAQFDLPYNQAPSLHIILAWLLWLRFYSHVTRWIRLWLTVWFILIGLSVLTTYQHHVIDVISGLLVGIMISYLIPMHGYWHWYKPTKQALIYVVRYLLVALVCCLMGWLIPYGYVFFWPAISLLMVALGYAGLEVSIFQKNHIGELSVSARIILCPYLLGVSIFQRWYCRRHAIGKDMILPQLWLGCFPYGQQQNDVVLDLTAEFHHAADDRHWVAYPLVDLKVPSIDDLYRAVILLRQLHQTDQQVLVCCALGLSRSATVVAAFLLMTRHANSVTEAISFIRTRRPQIILTAAHIQQLENFRKFLCQKNI